MLTNIVIITLGLYFALQLDFLTRLVIGYVNARSLSKRYQTELTRFENEMLLQEPSPSGDDLPVN